jgi:hypothetical protein
LIVTCCVDGRCGITGSDDNRDRGRRPVQRTKDSHTCLILSDRTIERSVDVVCDLHRARGDEERKFLG